MLDFAAHTPDHEGPATEEYAIRCTVCSYVIEAQIGHEHVFVQEVATDAYKAADATCIKKAAYYKSCTCGEKGTETFEYGDLAEHRPAFVWSKDKTGHWHACQTAGCKEMLDFAAHTPDHEGPATEEYAITCTECGYVIEKRLGSSTPSSPDPLGYRLPFASEPEEPSASSGFESDTTSDFTVDGAYQFRITSLDGTAPVMTASNASFRVELASREGNDYFFKIYAQGAAGSAAVISVNGTALLTATVGGSVSAVVSDTTHPFTVAQGGTYQFRLTASERPDFAAGSPSFTVEYAGRIGSDYFYKVRAVGQPGDGCGFYVNGEASPVAVATIA